MITYLSIDYGTKRIGLAVGDDQTCVAAPLKMLEATGNVTDDARGVLRVAQEYDVQAFVVGLPLNMDDSEGPQAKATRAFGDVLAVSADYPVHFFDERLSSVEARELMQPAELSRKKRKKRVDSIAAQVILQGFLDDQGPIDDPDRPQPDRGAD